jgi:outer membrane immunogenic protein
MKRNIIQTFAVSAILIAAPLTVASAADMPLKAPPPAPVPVYSWTGFYVGGNLGVGVGRDPTTNPRLISGFPPLVEQFDLSPAGAIGGGQIGYNWQAAPNWVLGVEADFEGSSQRDSRTCVLDCFITAGPGFVNTFEQFTQRLNWLDTVRGRLGWTNGPALFYATGGLAYGKVTTGENFFDGLTAPSAFAAAAGSFSETKTGWTVGAGIEAQLVGNWTGKIEYLYVNLGTVSGGPLFAPGAFVFPASTLGFSSTVQDHIVRVGVNYKFGDPIYSPSAPSAGYYKAPPAAAAYNWSGAYVGGNIGLGFARDPSAFADPADIVSEHLYLDPIGVVGGGQIGYNWQAASSWVLGAEADFQGTSQHDSATCLGAAGCPGDAINQKLLWFGTLRGRVGWSDGPTLYYGTGGFAYGDVKTNFNPIVCCSLFPLSIGGTQTGWTVGAGIETHLVGNWTGKIEYLYVDLGSESATGAIPPGVGPIPFSVSSYIRDNVVRIGVNYRL